MPDIGWKRDKELPSETFEIQLPTCGKLHLVVVKENDKVIEVRALIGRNSTCPAILLDSFAKILSCYLQSDFPRYRIVKKLRKFLPDTKGNRISCTGNENQAGCVESIIAKIIDQIE